MPLNLFQTFSRKGGLSSGGAPSYASFFAAETAVQLLNKVETVLPQADPVGLTGGVPLSPALEAVFNLASEIQAQLRHSHIGPLHLLAAITTQSPNDSAALLNEFGITLEDVLATGQTARDSCSGEGGHAVADLQVGGCRTLALFKGGGLDSTY